MTVNGEGIIEEVRYLDNNERAYLICTGHAGFGGDRDIYGENEIEEKWEFKSDNDCCEDPEYEDIDTHRFECTNCGQAGYYSGAAKRHYEGNGSEEDRLALRL